MSTLTTIQSTDLITNSRADINGNFSALNTDKMETSVLDTDTTLAANSDSKVPTQKAVKAYVDGVGVATATTTIKGLVEVATQAQVLAGAATGETGASIVVTPETLKGITGPVVKVYEVGDSPATWTKPTGLKYISVELCGGGGGADQDYYAGSGAGGYSRKIIAASTLGTTETVTIGAGGVTQASPTAGGTSSFGTHLSATGGAVSTASNGAGAGGGGSSGDVNITGGRGQAGDTSESLFGVGGSSFFGGMGAYGSGANAQTPTNGTAGVVIVTEYYV